MYGTVVVKGIWIQGLNFNLGYYIERLSEGWESTHQISERIAHFLRKNEQMSNSLKKTSDSLICSFLVSNLSD